jgi:DNA-binding SARP family transcriptional activator
LPSAHDWSRLAVPARNKTDMDFRILGPLEVLDEGRAVVLGGSKQRALLALLVLHANETLTTDRLIDELWGERPPAKAAKTVQMQISRLRKALRAGGGGLVVTREHGYVLELDPECLDAYRFERLVAEGGVELGAGRAERAAAALEGALALWRGGPLADLAYEPFAQNEIARLDDLRVGALERLIEARLALGAHAELVGQLETLIAEHPYRERLRAQLMLALYRCDRQADALQAYQDARLALVEEMGIEPGERLRELERAILAQDPGLAAPAGREDEDAAPRGPGPAELPTGVVSFLLTDIEDSSGHWETDPEGMAAALELHDELIADTVDAHAGRLLKTKGEGDATVSAFPRASDAVAAAVDIQEALGGASWPGELELWVRMAVHTGEAHERGGDYFGPALNRAARLRALTRGGATVVSQATAEIVHDRLPREAELVDLGRHQLRGLSRPENVFELRPVAAQAARGSGAVAVEPVALEAAVETPDGAFVGRERELAELVGGLADAFAGRGRLFLLVGEPGIGKSRLAEELIARARARRARVLVGRCWEAGGAPAYWPWVQSLRTYLRDTDAEDLRSQLGRGAADVAQLLPELRDVLADLPPAPALESEGARFRLFDSVSAFLQRAAAGRPLVLVLDDLHAADEPSLLLLRFVARQLGESRLLIVGAYRDVGPTLADPLTTTVSELAREPVTRTLSLAGVGEADVARLVERVAPCASAAELAAAVHAETEGNPLFVAEVLRLLVAEGALDTSLTPEGARLPLPDGVRATIRRRLDPVQPAVMRALCAAAVIGPEFRLPTLARVAGEDRTALLGHLDEASQAGLVEELPGGLGRYQFAHALIRETLYDGLAMQERVALHASVGEALVELYADRPDAPLSELAHHFLQAAPAGDPARAADYAARAGEQALEALAFEQAIDSFGDALRALDMEPGDPQRRGSILLAMGTAEMRAGRLEASRRTLRKAADLGRSLDDTELLARAALRSAPWGLATAMIDEEGLIPLLEEALERLPPTASALRARVLARLAATLYWSAPPDRRVALAEEAIALARQVDDAATLALVLSDAHLATWDPDSPERALPWASEIYALAEQVGNMELALTAHSWRISLLLELGELADVDLEIEAFARTAERLHQPRGQIGSHLHGCARALIDGRFDEAERLLEKAADFAGLLRQDQFLGMRVAALAFVMRYAQGRLPELEPAVRQFADAQPAMPVWRCGLLCVHLQTGNEAELRREYDRLAADSFGTLPRDNLWLPAAAFLAEACAHLGDRQGARTLESLLAPYAGRNVVTPDVAYVGPVDRYLALVAATAGDHEQAATWFASALHLARKMGARPMCAQLALDEAKALREHDPARSAALAADAAEQAEALGLERVAAEARGLLG